LPTCNIDDVMPIAEELVASGHAVWLHSNWLKITPAGMVAEGFNDEVVEFSDQYLDEMEANNYFGSDDDQQAIRTAWTAELSKLGFTVGETYWRDDFDSACDVALSLAVNSMESN